MKRKAVSGIMLTLLLTGMLTLAFNIQPVKSDWTWTETIYIRADGSVDPDTAPISTVDNNTYTFTDNIYDEIVVEKDNIVVDGAGYTLQGAGSGKGLDLTGRSNVTIKNMEIKQFVFGIYLNHSSSNSVIENDFISNAFECIRLYESSNNTIAANNLILNDIDGITLYGSSNNNITKNYLMNNYDGIRLYESSNNSITENIVIENYYGIFLAFSSENNIVNNNVTANHGTGISLYWSSNENRIVKNHITSNNFLGMRLDESSNNVIYHNNFVDNTEQVHSINSTSVWDDSYPSGGNYWSDHVTVDNYSGINQDELGSDGIVDEPYIIDSYNRDNYPLVKPWRPVISATIDIDPDTLNLKSKGKWITCYIELPEGYNVSDIDVSTIMLNDTIPVSLLDVPTLDPVPTVIGDYDEDGIPDLMVKFDRAEVMALLSVGEATLTLTGKVNDISFEDSDTIRVIVLMRGPYFVI